jgi:hypothetical protein
MVVAEPEGIFSAGVSPQVTTGFQVISGQKEHTPHRPDIQYNESHDNTYEKGDAMQAEEFATVNVHDFSLPRGLVLIIPDRKLLAG